MIILHVYGTRLTPEIVMIDSMLFITNFWHLACLVSTIFDKNNVTATKD